MKRLAFILAAVLTVALGCALASVCEQGRPSSGTMFDAPCAPAPQFLAQDVRPLPAPYLQADCPRESAGADRPHPRRLHPSEPPRQALLAFPTLHRRPPPQSL